MELMSISWGRVCRQRPKVRVTADFHGNDLDSSRRHSAHVAAPEN